ERFPQLPASLIHCAKHTVLLVNVYSNVIHENISFLFSSTLCTEGLLSFYLTPFYCCRTADASGLRNIPLSSNSPDRRETSAYSISPKLAQRWLGVASDLEQRYATLDFGST